MQWSACWSRNCAHSEHACTQFVIVTAPDAKFQRRGSDLHHNVTISLVDALVGFTMEVRQ